MGDLFLRESQISQPVVADQEVSNLVEEIIDVVTNGSKLKCKSGRHVIVNLNIQSLSSKLSL